MAKAAVMTWAEEDIYETQTPCHKLDRWDDPKIPLTMLITFHLIPGNDPEWSWKTTENSPRVQRIEMAAEKSQD